jgi:hypothetical protein
VLELEILGSMGMPLAYLLGATVGALTVALGQVFRLGSVVWVVYMALMVLAPNLNSLLNMDWELVRTWGWGWIAASLPLLAVAVLGGLVVCFRQLRGTASFPQSPFGVIITIGLAALTLTGSVGAIVTAAMLFGQIGLWIAGQPGLEIGETLGGLLGLPLGWVIIHHFFYSKRKGSSQGGMAIYWIGLGVSMVLADGGVLWLLVTDQSTGIRIACYEKRDLAFVDSIFGLATSSQCHIAAAAVPEAFPLWRHQQTLLKRFQQQVVAPWSLSYRSLGAWDVASGGELPKLAGADSNLHTQCFAISSDGRHLLAGSEFGVLRLWDLNTGQELWQLAGPKRPILSVTFAPQGTPFMAVAGDGLVSQWQTASFKEERLLELPSANLRCAAFSPDGRQLLVGFVDGSVRLWDLTSRQQIRVLEGHRGPVTCLGLSADGRKAISGSKDHTVRIWDLPTGQPLGVFRGNSSVTGSVAFSAAANAAIAASLDGTVCVWRLEEPQTK